MYLSGIRRNVSIKNYNKCIVTVYYSIGCWNQTSFVEAIKGTSMLIAEII